MSMGRKRQKTQEASFHYAHAAEGVCAPAHLPCVSSDAWLSLVTGALRPYFRRSDLGGPGQSLPPWKSGEKS